MSVIYYHHASGLKSRQMTSKVFNISTVHSSMTITEGKDKYTLFPDFPVILIYCDPRPFWLIGFTLLQYRNIKTGMRTFFLEKIFKM